MEAAEIQCPACKKMIPIERFLDSGESYDPGLKVLFFRCFDCGSTVEAQVEHGVMWLGYIYAAGAAHFAAMEKVNVDGLSVNRCSRSVEIRLGDRNWTIGDA